MIIEISEETAVKLQGAVEQLKDCLPIIMNFVITSMKARDIPLIMVEGVGQKTVERLEDKDIKTLEELINASEKVLKQCKIPKNKILAVKQSAQDLLKNPPVMEVVEREEPPKEEEKPEFAMDGEHCKAKDWYGYEFDEFKECSAKQCAVYSECQKEFEKINSEEEGGPSRK